VAEPIFLSFLAHNQQSLRLAG